MAMIRYSVLLPEVTPYLASDPTNPLAISAIRSAVIDLCKGSWIWRHYPDAINVVSGTREYELEAPSSATVSRVLSCRYDGEKLDPRSTDQLDEEYPTWLTDTGSPQYFTQTEPGTIILSSIPEENITGGLVLTLALQPTQSSITFPDWIAAQYMEEIAAGARGKLMLMPGKAWTDAATGAMHSQKLKDAIANARQSAVGGISRAVLRTTSQH